MTSRPVDYRPTVVCDLEPGGVGRCRRCDGHLTLDAEARDVLEQGGYTVCVPCLDALIQTSPQAVHLYGSS